MEVEEGKWEKLPKDCLVKILGGVGMESLLYDVPFVCKSWYHASLDPMCWQVLDFSKFKRPESVMYNSLFLEDEIVDAFIKSVVDRSRKSATKVVLPSSDYSSRQVVKSLEYISNECPDLKFLRLPLGPDMDGKKRITELMVKWRSLEILYVENYSLVVEILTQIQLHCKNFVGFLCDGYCEIGHAEALSMISIPGMKYLQFTRCYIHRDALEMIIVNCKNLEVLMVKYCMGFEVDSELLNLASHIKLFQCDAVDIYYPPEGKDEEDGLSDSDLFLPHNIVVDDEVLCEMIRQSLGDLGLNFD